MNATTFEESQGSECSTSYAIRDVAENPSVSFTLTEENGTKHSATTFGDPIYISNTDGLYELVDYAEGSISGWRASTSYPDLVAIAYIGDVTVDVVNSMLPASSPITECDAGTTCHVYYVLNADGDLYQFITVPIWDTTAAAGEEVSATLVRGRLGNIGVTFEDTMNVSMDYISLADSNGLLIADATDASIYYANLTQQDAETHAIPTGKVCKLNGVTGISGLYSAAPTASGDSIPADLLKMMGIETKAPVNVAKVQAPAKGEEDGYALETGALISMRSDSMTALDVSEMSSKARLESAGEAVNASTGSLNALKVKQTERPQSIKPSTGDAANHVLTVTISDDVAVTNGKYVVEYDPAKVTLTSKTSSQAYKSFNVDETNGKITFAFAAEEAVAANTTLATLTFSYGDYVNTEITVKALERNEVSPVEGDEKVIKIEDEVEHKYGEPVWSWTGVESATATFTCEHDATHTQVVNATITSEVTKPATCTEDGVRTYTATVTFEGKTYTDTKTRTLPATGHNFRKNAQTGKYVCENCGKVLGESENTKPTKPTTPTKPGKNDTKFPFIDVSKNDRYYDAVDYLYNNGIMNGTTDTLFSPNAELTRAMVVTILYRAQGKPAVSTSGSFKDVAAGRYYTEAVEWAAANNIVKGFTDGTFKPDEPVTREQLAAFISRYAEYNGIEIVAADGKLDADAVVSNWAKKNVEWAVAEGILTSAQAKNATQNATRAEVAMALYTYLTKVAK